MDGPNLGVLLRHRVENRTGGVATAVVAYDDLELLDSIQLTQMIEPVAHHLANTLSLVEGRSGQRQFYRSLKCRRIGQIATAYSAMILGESHTVTSPP